MKLREINLENEFMVIIKSDFRDADYFEKESTHPNVYYTETMAFLTIIQDIYNKKHELQENQKKFFDIAKYLDEYIKTYFEKYTDTNILEISKYADSWITDEVSDFMPDIYFDDYFYPRTLEHIKIVKDGKVYIFDEDQPEEDIKQAQEFVINWLKSCVV